MPVERRVLAAVVLAALASGCSRTHLSTAFGRARHDALAAQQGNAKAPPPNMKLDTQEARVISASYLQSLAPDKSVKEPEPVLVVTPSPRSGQTQLPPSVPRQ